MEAEAVPAARPRASRPHLRRIAFPLGLALTRLLRRGGPVAAGRDRCRGRGGGARGGQRRQPHCRGRRASSRRARDRPGRPDAARELARRARPGRSLRRARLPRPRCAARLRAARVLLRRLPRDPRRRGPRRSRRLGAARPLRPPDGGTAPALVHAGPVRGRPARGLRPDLERTRAAARGRRPRRTRLDRPVRLPRRADGRPRDGQARAGVASPGPAAAARVGRPGRPRRRGAPRADLPELRVGRAAPARAPVDGRAADAAGRPDAVGARQHG